jgi:hypothetical protein
MKRYYLILIFCFWHINVQGAVTVELDPPTVQLGETFRLTLTQNDGPSNNVPDLIPLEQNFNIVGTERRMSYTVINGRAKSLNQWSLLLVAKRVGTLTIPTIKIGQQSSNPSQIVVTDNGAVAKAPANEADTAQALPKDILLTSEVSTKKPLLNEQVIYTVKLYTRQQLLDAFYQPPAVEDAVMIPLGQGRHPQETLNGQSYAVEEQKYAIFPQKSGVLTITSPTLTALVYDEMPRRIKVRTKAVKLTVKPIPATYSNKAWLPAKQVTLSEQYDVSAQTFLQGSTLERTVTLEATAVPAQLLPNLSFKRSQAFSVYPEKPTTKNVFKQGELVGTTKIKVTYLLNKPGKIVIPALTIKWFNTTLGQEEVASLPARSLTVENKLQEVQASKTTVQQAPSTTLNKTGRQFNRTNYQLIAWVLGALVVAWILPLFLWWSCRRVFARKRQDKRSLLQLRDACLKNDPAQTRIAVMQWAAFQWPDKEFLTINDIMNVINDPELKKQLQALSRALYRQNSRSNWQGQSLWQCINTYKASSAKKKNEKNNLPPMNPS